MDAYRFDSLARVIGEATTRRSLVSLFGGATLGGLLGSRVPVDAAGKKKKKKACPPCKKRKKGKCKGILPDGTACDFGTCQGGSCRCPDGDFICEASTPDVCCKNADSCNGYGCVAKDLQCRADNHFCTNEFAHCANDGSCACFQKKQDGSVFCASLDRNPQCPESEGCFDDNECPGDEVCLNFGCRCPEQPTAGVCLPRCT